MSEEVQPTYPDIIGPIKVRDWSHQNYWHAIIHPRGVTLRADDVDDPALWAEVTIGTDQLAELRKFTKVCQLAALDFPIVPHTDVEFMALGLMAHCPTCGREVASGTQNLFCSQSCVQGFQKRWAGRPAQQVMIANLVAEKFPYVNLDPL